MFLNFLIGGFYSMKNFFKKVIEWVKSHKWQSGAIGLGLVAIIVVAIVVPVSLKNKNAGTVETWQTQPSGGSGNGSGGGSGGGSGDPGGGGSGGGGGGSPSIPKKINVTETKNRDLDLDSVVNNDPFYIEPDDVDDKSDVEYIEFKITQIIDEEVDSNFHWWSFRVKFNDGGYESYEASHFEKDESSETLYYFVPVNAYDSIEEIRIKFTDFDSGNFNAANLCSVRLESLTYYYADSFCFDDREYNLPGEGVELANNSTGVIVEDVDLIASYIDFYFSSML